MVVNAQDTAMLNRENQLSVFPQPASSQITISFRNSNLTSATVHMYDMLGNLVSEVNADRFDQSTFTFYVGDKKPGYYFLKIYTDEGTFSRRVTIKP